MWRRIRRKLLDKLRLLWKVDLLERALVRFTIGRPYGALITKFPPQHHQYRKGTYRHVVRDGIRYELDIADIVDWFIYFGFEDQARKRLYGLIHLGNMVIDVGANVGDITMHMAKLVGPEGRVYAFEPHPVNHGRVMRNLALNAFGNIKLERMGLGNDPGKFAMQSRDDANQGMNRIVPGSQGISSDESIDVTTLDDYVRENGLRSLEVIKIDVEGFESRVIQGGMATLRRWKPVLFIEVDEVNLAEQGSSPQQLLALLVELGYRFEDAATEKPITMDDGLAGCHFDMIAWPKSVEH